MSVLFISIYTIYNVYKIYTIYKILGFELYMYIHYI